MLLMLFALAITARQYGEVVLPDAASGQNPDSPRQRGHETVTVQGGYGVLFAVMAQILLNAGAIAVQFGSEPRTYPRLQNCWRSLAQCRDTICLEARNLSRYIEIKLGVVARIWLQEPLQICLGSRSKSKKHDKQLTHIVRVSG
jgi:hypothetical protein